ncbi:MAG TPA: hypothetical protein VGC06_28185 [Actinomycetes bacterium]
MSPLDVEERLRALREQAQRREVPPDAWLRLQRRVRREPRRRAALVAGVALAVLVASVVPAVLARRAAQSPVPDLGNPATNPVPRDWKQYRDTRQNYSFRYPPGWVVKPNGVFPGQAMILPPESAAVPLSAEAEARLPFFMTAANGNFYYAAYAALYPPGTSGRLPGGRPFLQTGEPEPPGQRFSRYIIDWGRFCLTDPRPDPGTPATDCGAHALLVTISGKTALWDRYHAIATTIVRSMAPLRKTRPSAGDRSRPACRPDQWTIALPNGWSFGTAGDGHGMTTWHISGGIRYLRHGPPCHLRLRVQATAENPDGTPLRVPGTPAATSIEGDLPEDGSGPTSPSVSTPSIPESPLQWNFHWENWCRQPLGQARVRIAAGGRSATQPAPESGYGNCRNLGPGAPWRIVPVP